VLKRLSLVGFVLMVVAIVALFRRDSLFSWSPLVIGAQVAAVALMVWARMTFGKRSFHAAANPTAGGLVTTGPYRYIRHPIYTAACLFCFAGVAGHWSPVNTLLGILMLVGSLVRMMAEEQMVVAQYPEYRAYAERTSRMVPNVF
jgi:protein-S-isoprenylcysteine O-methyltransferase Ste14